MNTEEAKKEIRKIVELIFQKESLEEDIRKKTAELQNECPHDWDYHNVYEDSGHICNICGKFDKNIVQTISP